MDVEAARRARRNAIRADLRQAYTDEEASPPEWVDLLADISETRKAIVDRAAAEVAAFVGEADIRTALARRDRAAARIRDDISALNAKVRRLNLIAPNQRFTTTGLDAEDVLRPLYRSARARTD